MDWRSAEQRLVRGITDLQEELTMWQPDLVSAVAVLEPVGAIPLEVQLRAEVAAPHRDRVSLYAAAAFALENSGLVATTDVNLDQVESVVPGRRITQPEGETMQAWVRAEIDAQIGYLRSHVPAIRRWTESAAEPKPLPQRSVVRQRLVDLISGRRSRKSLTGWATHYVLHDDEYEVTDWLVWRTLGSLRGADAQIAPGDYLYGTTDFRAWLSDLDGKRD